MSGYIQASVGMVPAMVSTFVKIFEKSSLHEKRANKQQNRWSLDYDDNGLVENNRRLILMV